MKRTVNNKITGKAENVISCKYVNGATNNTPNGTECKSSKERACGSSNTATYKTANSSVCGSSKAEVSEKRKTEKSKICVAVYLCAVAFILLFLPSFGCKTQTERTTTYTLKAEYDSDGQTVKCSMNVCYVNGSDDILDNVCFHLYPSAFREDAQFYAIDVDGVDDAFPNGRSYGGIEISEVKESGQTVEIKIEGADDDILTVPLYSPLKPTENVEISIDFSLTLPNVKHRFGYFDDVVNLGNWYPIACVKEESGFDTSPYYSNGDPFCSDIADYVVEITVPADYVVASSGKQEKTENGLFTTYKCSQTKIRDFALSIGRFTVAESQVGSVLVKYYSKNNVNVEKRLKCAVDAIKCFSDKFYKYPYPVYSVVETPFLYGGMEYPTIVFVSDSLNESLTDEAIIHETAHQWWYGLVGSDEIDHAWQDEGLTEYSTTLFYEWNPDYNVSYSQRMADAISAFTVYSSVTTDDGVMDKKINRFSAFDYTYITYLKGELMFDVIRKSIGDDAFFTALKEYAKQGAYKINSPDEMIAVFEKSSSRPLRSVFESFMYGSTKAY